MTDMRPSAAAMRELRTGLDVGHKWPRLSVDAHVAWGVAVAMAFAAGMIVGPRGEPAPTCPSTLPDGRRLQSYEIAERKCIYELVKPSQWRPM